MRILKKGRIPEDRIWEGTCRHCGSVMEEDANNLDIHLSRDQREEDCAKAECPVCTREFTLYATKRYSTDKAPSVNAR